MESKGTENLRKSIEEQLASEDAKFVARILALDEKFDARILSLNEKFDARICGLEEKLAVSHKALIDKLDTSNKVSDEKIILAMNSLDKRLEGMNEFRATLTDQTKTFTTKDKVDSDLLKISERIDKTERALLILDTKASQKSIYVAYAITGIGMLVSIITLLLKFQGTL